MPDYRASEKPAPDRSCQPAWSDGRPTQPVAPRPHIDPADRARQFLPFAALKGYYDLVRAQERVPEPRHELTDDEAARLSSRVVSLSKGDMVRVTYYDVDAYVTVTGVLSGVDTAFKTLTVVKRKIAFEDVLAVERVEGPVFTG